MSRKFDEKVENYVLSVIEDRAEGKRASFLRFVLGQLSGLFTGIVQFRLWCYRHGLLRYHTLGCQVVSVGNLTVGGTGKTPVVEKLARSLQESGRRVAILSRGYKKEKKKIPFLQKWKMRVTFQDIREQPAVVSDGNRILLDSRYSGDEPYMLASNLPNVAVIVGKSRVLSGLYAIKKLKCDTLILDDGFQHLALKHRLDIVLVDRTNPFGNGRTLPRGILREPPRNIKRAGFIFITKSNGDGAAELTNKLRQLNPTAEISECRHCPRYLRNVFSEERQELDFLDGKRVIALSGIAAPRGFEMELVRHGSSVLKHHIFADHHRYVEQEIIEIMNGAVEMKADAIITTEKDAVRIPKTQRREVPIYYLRVEIEMFRGEDEFDAWIRRLCFE